VEVSALFTRTLQTLSSHGAQLLYLNESMFDPQNLALAEVAVYEFKEAFHEYINTHGHHSCPNLTQVLSSGLVDPIAVGPTWDLAQLPTTTTLSPDYLTRLQRIKHLQLALAKTFAKNNLTALVYPHQTVLAAKIGAKFQAGRNGLLTSLTGTPSIAIPMGFSSTSQTAIRGVPVGMEVIGLWGWDWKVLQLAELMEAVLEARHAPTLVR
jgi:amidase